MSAVIHPFPGHERRLGVPDAPGTDDPGAGAVLAERAAAVDGAAVRPGRRLRPAPRATGRDRPVPARLASRGGANDLVASEAASPAARRHHRALAAGTVALALVLALLVGPVGGWVGPDVPTAGTTTLQDGDTLWEVATEITPAGRDVRHTVALLLEVNDLDSPTVPAGTPLLLPDLG